MALNSACAAVCFACASVSALRSDSSRAVELVCVGLGVFERRARALHRACGTGTRHVAGIAVYSHELRQQGAEAFGNISGDGSLACNRKRYLPYALAAVSARGRNDVTEVVQDGGVGNPNVAHTDRRVQSTLHGSRGHHGRRRRRVRQAARAYDLVVEQIRCRNVAASRRFPRSLLCQGGGPCKRYERDRGFGRHDEIHLSCVFVWRRSPVRAG